jgi:hypothetical protein
MARWISRRKGLLVLLAGCVLNLVTVSVHPHRALGVGLLGGSAILLIAGAVTVVRSR